MRIFRNAAARALLLTGAVCAAIHGAAPAAPFPPAAPRDAAGPVTTLAVRSGDPAPLTARFERFGREALPLAGEGLLFTDGGGALFIKGAEGVRALAHAGMSLGEGARLASIFEIAAASGGWLAFRAALAGGGEALYRLAGSEAAFERALGTGDQVMLAGGPATVGIVSGPAIDAGGTIVAGVDFLEAAAAIVRLRPGSPPEVLLQSGDAVGSGRLLRLVGPPGASPSGRIAFAAALDTGAQVVASLDGTSATILFMIPPGAFASLAPSAPAINDAGAVAFVWADRGIARVQRIASGASATVAAPGTPVPGGGALASITSSAADIDPSGAVLFGAARAAAGGGPGPEGVYRAAAQIETMIEVGMEPVPGAAIVSLQPTGATPRFGPDGSLARPGLTVAGPAVVRRSAGVLAFAVAPGTEVPPPARFSVFIDARAFPRTGPALGPDGRLLFDACVTGGTRGLFARDRAGRLELVTREPDRGQPRDPAGPGFAYHSVGGGGRVVFLDAPVDAPAALPALFERDPGGAPRRILGAGDPVPGGGALAGSPLPSRLDGERRIAALVADDLGATAILAREGDGVWYRITGAGDAAPEGGFFVRILPPSLYETIAFPPVLDPSGRVIFAAETSRGDLALFAARLVPGGAPVARLAGAGDDVDGGRLAPLTVAALDARAGAMALRTVYDDSFSFGVFLQEAEGTAPRAVARRFDRVGDRGFVFGTTNHLALAGAGRLAYGVVLFDGTRLILRAEPDQADAAVVAAEGDPSPDGGVYLSFEPALSGPSFLAVGPGLASDGEGTLAFAARTSEGPEGIFLFGEVADLPPVARAGDDIVAECAAPEGTAVTLDGGASSDPEGGPLTFEWRGPFGAATGPRPTVILPLGTHAVTLLVKDGAASAEDEVMVSVRDTLPPSILARAAPDRLWPPDGRPVAVRIAIDATDRCDAAPAVTLDAAVSGEADPGGIAGADIDTDDREVTLSAARHGSGPGRIYTLVYAAADASGNSAATTATITVPHDQASPR